MDSPLQFGREVQSRGNHTNKGPLLYRTLKAGEEKWLQIFQDVAVFSYKNSGWKAQISAKWATIIQIKLLFFIGL